MNPAEDLPVRPTPVRKTVQPVTETVVRRPMGKKRGSVITREAAEDERDEEDDVSIVPETVVRRPTGQKRASVNAYNVVEEGQIPVVPDTEVRRLIGKKRASVMAKNNEEKEDEVTPFTPELIGRRGDKGLSGSRRREVKINAPPSIARSIKRKTPYPREKVSNEYAEDLSVPGPLPMTKNGSLLSYKEPEEKDAEERVIKSTRPTPRIVGNTAMTEGMNAEQREVFGRLARETLPVTTKTSQSTATNQSTATKDRYLRNMRSKVLSGKTFGQITKESNEEPVRQPVNLTVNRSSMRSRVPGERETLRNVRTRSKKTLEEPEEPEGDREEPEELEGDSEEPE